MELLQPGVGIIFWSVFMLLVFVFFGFFMFVALRYMRKKIRENRVS